MAQAQQQFSTRRVRIAPKPGYVLKTSTTAPGFYTPSSATGSGALFPVPAGTKVFINVAYDRAVPSPQASVAGGAEMTAEHEDEYIQETLDGDPDSLYWVPIVVSDGRHELDKAGKPSLAFDAVVNPSLKPRILRDINYRTYLLEIIISQIEKPPDAAATAGLHAPRRQLTLSRTMAIPNIRAKGALETREVDVPDFRDAGVIRTRTYQEIMEMLKRKEEEEEEAKKEEMEKQKAEERRDSGVAAAAVVDEKEEKEKEKGGHEEKEEAGTIHRPRIEVLPDPSPVPKPPPKSILKKHTTAPKRDEDEEDPHVVTDADKKLQTPTWRWEGGGDPEAKMETVTGTRRLVIDLPNFTRADHASSALFVSRREEDDRRVITLRTSAHFLQVVVEGAGADDDVDVLGRIRAEWRVRDERVVVYT